MGTDQLVERRRSANRDRRARPRPGRRGGGRGSRRSSRARRESARAPLLARPSASRRRTRLPRLRGARERARDRLPVRRRAPALRGARWWTRPAAGALADAAAPAAAVFDPDAEDAGGAVSFSVLHGLYWLTNNLAGEEPTLLFVDDLHWCDRPSLRFLAYLATGSRHLRSARRRAAQHRARHRSGPDRRHPRRPEHGGDPARPAQRRRGRRDRRRALRARRATSSSRRLPAGDRRQSAPPRQLLSGLALEGTTPTAGDASAIAEVGPRAVSRTVLRASRRLPAEATAVARAVAILGDGTELRPSRSSRGSRSRRRAGHRRPRPGGDPALRLATRVRPPAGPRRDLPGHPAGRAPAPARAGGRADAGRRRATEKVAAQLLVAPPSGEEWVAGRLGGGGRRAHQGRSGERCHLPGADARGAARGRRASGVLLGLGIALVESNRRRRARST